MEYLSKDQSEKLQEQINEVGRLLNGLMKSLEKSK